MLTVDLSRAQFAATTVYHFFFVPVTIGLAFLWPLCRPSGIARANHRCAV